MKTVKTLLVSAMLCCSSVAAAGTITLQWDGYPFNPGPPAGPYDYSVTTGGSTHTGSVYPDRYHGTITNASGVDPFSMGDGTGIPEGLFTYCYELTQYFSGGQSYVYGVMPGAVTSSTLDFLGAVNSVNTGFGTFGWMNPSNANMAAAIQLGIWETLYDNGTFDLTGGSFFISSSLGAGAGSVADYLSQFTGAMAGSTDLSPLGIARLTNADAQDQITALRVAPPLLVPEPDALLLTLAGLLAAQFARRRKSRS